MTTPDPALALNTNPAFTTVNMANPTAFCRTVRGIIRSKPLLFELMKLRTEESDVSIDNDR
jgi:hypothetical protein